MFPMVGGMTGIVAERRIGSLKAKDAINGKEMLVCNTL